MVIVEIIANIMLLAGVIIFGLAVVGLFKFTDTFQRVSAVGTAAALGMSLLIIGAFLLVPSWMNFLLVLIILFLQMATSSVGTMAIARSAYLTGSTMQPGYFDHLAEDQGKLEADVIPDRDIDNDTNDDADSGDDDTVISAS